MSQPNDAIKLQITSRIENVTKNVSYDEDESYHMLKETHVVEYYTFPFIFSIGTICNILTFIVMRRKKMRHQSTYFYMAVLAIADEVVLINGCLNFLIYLYTGKNVLIISVISCKISCFALYATMHFSVWMVVIMTVERFIAVALPLQANRLCTVTRAKLATSCLALVVLIINLHFMFTHSLIKRGSETKAGCQTSSEEFDNFMSNIWPWIDASIYSFIPLSLLVTINILIVHNLIKASKKIEKMNKSTNLNHMKLINKPQVKALSADCNSLGSSKSRLSNNINVNNTGKHKVPSSTSSANRRLTIMLLVVSMTFLITSLPIVTLQTIEKANLIQREDKILFIIRGIFLFLQYLNHSINFFLYAVTGETFRREFFALFKTCKKRYNNNNNKNSYESPTLTSKSNHSNKKNQLIASR